MSRAAILKNLPPIVGLLVMVAAALVLRRWMLLAVPIGLLTWYGAHLALTRLWIPQEQSRRRNRVRAIPDSRTRQDMAQALAKIETLHDLNQKIPDEGLTSTLNELAKAAAFLVDETTRKPAKAGASHKALALYLDDAVTVSQRFADLQRFRSISAQEIEKTNGSLKQLVILFQAYAERMRVEEALDLDIQISVLEDRLRAEGIFDR